MKSLRKLMLSKPMPTQLLPLLVLLLTTLWSGQALAQEAEVAEGRGVVQELIVESNRLIISGVEYRVAYDAQVQIRGSYGAYSMLQTDMKVAFEYRRFGPDELEIFTIEQLPDNTILDES